MFDGKAFGAEIVGVVKDYLERQLSPVLDRIEALEKQLAELPTPKDGKDADPLVVASMVAGEIKADLAKMRETLDAIQPAPELPDVAGMIERAVGAIPAPISADEIKGMIEGELAALPPAPELPDVSGMIEAAVAAIPAPISPEEIKALAAEVIDAQPAPEPVAINYSPSPEQIREWAGMVADVIELPVPKGITLEDVTPMIEERIAKGFAELPVPKDGKDGKDGEPGKDGVGMAGGIIDRDGHLNFTMTDGTLRDLGKVCGKDGEPGKPGADGFGFEDMSEELADDGRTLIKRYIKGERVKEFRHALSVVLYQGIWKEGTEYQTGDSVTFNGSQFIARCPTTAKPETSKDWQLSVKRGRDGKDGVMKAEKPRGPISVGVPAKKDGQ